MGSNHRVNIFILILATIGFHAIALPFTYENTYDAYIHMFFGDHYHKSWFDPWEPRWYTGFNTISYPPATHMMQGFLANLVEIRYAYILTMLTALVILVLGVYRFSLIFCSPSPAFLAGLITICSTAVVQTVHIYGQLPTIFSLALFLNALPYVHEWLIKGKLSSLILAILLSAATTSAHHVTTIFGAIFFIGPLAAYSLIEYLAIHQSPEPSFQNRLKVALTPISRGIVLALLMMVIVFVTIFPYWIWSITDPIQQVAIPHGTRENFLNKPHLLFAFFTIPWGLTIIFLPLFFLLGIKNRSYPFLIAILIGLILGTGGTTPLPKIILGPAFDILTLERFTFWAVILSMPFIASIMNASFQKIQINQSLKPITLPRLQSAILLCLWLFLGILVAIMPKFNPLQPEKIDPQAIINFMNVDDHSEWRYLTLGFGDQLAYISSKLDAQTVDGNYHSARRLEDLTSFAVERLDNAKFLGVAGLGSLQNFLFSPEEYHLKFVLSNDAFYDPLLYFSGWEKLVRLPNNIVIWERAGIKPLPENLPRVEISNFSKYAWGIIPPLAFIIGLFLIARALLILIKEKKETASSSDIIINFDQVSLKTQKILISSTALVYIFASFLLIFDVPKKNLTPQYVIESYFNHLDEREFDEAYALLAKSTRPSFAEFDFQNHWFGGMVNSFAKFEKLRSDITKIDENFLHAKVNIEYLTSIGYFSHDEELQLVNEEGDWRILYHALPAPKVIKRLTTRPEIDYQLAGRRQALFQNDLYEDIPDRPSFSLNNLQLIKYNNQYKIIGEIRNTDIDPLQISFSSQIFGNKGQELAESGGGLHIPHRLAPMESSGFLLNFDEFLDFQTAKTLKQFDPELFLPKNLTEEVDHAEVSANSLILANNLYRQYALSDINLNFQDSQLIIKGKIHNSGAKDLSTAKIIVTIYDENKRPIWVEIAYPEQNINVGRSAEFQIKIPNIAQIEHIEDIDISHFNINGANENRPEFVPNADEGTIFIGKNGIYSLRFYVDPMIQEIKF